MRKFTTIVLLASFIIVQYAKQVGYLECKLSNYFKVTAQKCDCGKALEKNKETPDPSPVPVSHHHIHVDESYYPTLLQTPWINTEDNSAAYAVHADTAVRDGIYSKPEHPPQFG